MFNQTNLELCFNGAKENNAKYIGVLVRTPKSEEVIVINSKDFDSKLEYYKGAYTDELKLNANSEVEIIGFTFGNSYSVLEYDLQTSETYVARKFELSLRYDGDMIQKKDAERVLGNLIAELSMDIKNILQKDDRFKGILNFKELD